MYTLIEATCYHDEGPGPGRGAELIFLLGCTACAMCARVCVRACVCRGGCAGRGGADAHRGKDDTDARILESVLWLRIETRDEIKIHILTLKDVTQRPEAANRLKPSDETAVPGQRRDPELDFKQRRTQPHERFTADSAAAWMVATVFAPK
jgi:hypothetical protein